MLKIVDQHRATLPELDPNTGDWHRFATILKQHEYLREAEIAAARMAMAKNDLAKARAIVGRVSHRRPNAMLFPATYMENVWLPTVQHGGGGLEPRNAVQDAWRAFDTLQWDLADRDPNKTERPIQPEQIIRASRAHGRRRAVCA